MANFLLEIGTEEIPAGYIRPALGQMANIFREYLAEARLECKEIRTLGTPRRLVLFTTGLPRQQASYTKEIMGPRQGIAFDEAGKPTPALLGFTRRYQASPYTVKLKDTNKGKICYLTITTKGEKTEIILSRLIPLLLSKISFAKSMWWQEKSLTFARPIRYLLALFNQRPLKVSISNIVASNKTFGHHILAPRPITMSSANLSQYKKRLNRAYVVVDDKERRSRIANSANRILAKYGSRLDNGDLLNEVTNLVEYPVALEGSFNQKFLVLPEAVLESAMKSQQRYFPVRDRYRKIQPKFIVISNGGKNQRLIKEGNERVLNARLADAVFFWEKDKKTRLEAKVEGLKEVAFLGNLGSYYEKIQRLKYVAEFILSNLDNLTELRSILHRSAELCKADLLTGMVGEFPDLQGIMGYEYARLQGELPEVARAIREHYLPRYQNDAVPESRAGIILALAEKFDNLAACFTLNLKPTGSQDPYALRRQTLGIIRIILHHNLALSYRKIVLFALEQIQKTMMNLPGKTKPALKAPREYADEIMLFLRERLHQLCLDEKYPYDFIRATLVSGFDNLTDFKLRLDTLVKLARESLWSKLVTVVERTYNIGKDVKVSGLVREDLFEEPEERQLWEIYKNNRLAVQHLIDQKRYLEAARLYTKTFAGPVHTFFDRVFVNVDNAALRNNRILLVKHINRLYSDQIADLSRIVTEKE